MSNIISKIVEALNEKKVEEIEVLADDDRDYILANSLNGRHTLALFEHLKKDFFIGKTDIDLSDEWGCCYD